MSVPRVIVVVPVYNVAAYLPRCIESLACQTYKDWRAILVDDGSTDEGGKICDEAAARDSRIKVVHQSNAGVAAARNVGVKAALEAGATHITFIDPDDWVPPEYLETLIAGLQAGADLVSVGYQDVSPNETEKTSHKEQFVELSGEEYWFTSNVLSSVVWGKLIAREIIDKIVFPIGRVHEDETVLPELVFSAKKIVHSSARLYRYWHRETSITRGDNEEKWTRKSLDHIPAIENQIAYFERHDLKLPLTAARRLLVTYLTKAIVEVGAAEYRPRLRRVLKELDWTKDFDEPYFRLAFPMEAKIMKLLPKAKKAIKCLLPYGLIRAVQIHAEKNAPEPEEKPFELEFAVEKHPEGKNVFLVDEHIPAYDRDAGGRQISIYVRILTEMGYKVYLVGEDAYRREPYASEFENLGVTVMSGESFSPANRALWWQKNGENIDYAFLHRPQSASAYMPLVRMYAPKAKVIFFGADLAQVRLQREYELTKREELKEEIRIAKLQEDYLYMNSDVNLCVGAAETEFVGKVYPKNPVHEIPLFIYDKFFEETTGFAARKDLLFCGGFNHRPNRDAVEWFLKEIFPEIVKAIPDIKFNIVGSNTPEAIKAMASERVVVHGFISDEKLRELYETCRVTVAPLRYGAGVKGKIVDALYNRTAVVTTTIGAEGIPHDPMPFAIADDAKAFADEVVKVYTDEHAWNKSRAQALEVLKATYSRQQAERLIGNVFARGAK